MRYVVHYDLPKSLEGNYLLSRLDLKAVLYCPASPLLQVSTRRLVERVEMLGSVPHPLLGSDGDLKLIRPIFVPLQPAKCVLYYCTSPLRTSTIKIACD